MEDKEWYKSLTVWGCVCMFAGAGLEAVGYPGIVATAAQVVGLPLAGIGVRRVLAKTV